jgi:hypothetical protein
MKQNADVVIVGYIAVCSESIVCGGFRLFFLYYRKINQPDIYIFFILCLSPWTFDSDILDKYGDRLVVIERNVF